MRSNRLQLNTAKTEILWCSTTRRQNHLPSAAVRVRENHVLPSTTVCDLGVFININVLSYVMYGVRVFHCVMTAPQHQTFSVWFCVPLAGHVAGYAMSRLLQCNTCRTSCVSAQSTSVGAQCRRQTDTSIFSVWAHHTNTARPTLVVVSGTHRFQVSCAHLPMPASSGATVSFRLRVKSSSLQLVIRHTQLSTVGDCAFPVAACGRVCCPTSPQLQRWLFFETTSKLISFPNHFLLNCFRLLVLHTVYSSGLAVLYFRPL